MESFDLEKEKKVHPYEHYGKVFEKVHNNSRFLMRSALYYVIDDYDEYLGSVEQSHYEELNYNEVIDFNQSEFDSTLDLTWMNTEDVFQLRSSEQYLALDEIIVNIDNLGYSRLPSSNDAPNLKISALNSKTSFIQQIKAFGNFVLNNKVNTITFIDFNPVVESILMLYAKKAGITVGNYDLTDEVKRHR